MTHIDAGALEYFETLECGSLLDVGCGPGGQVECAHLKGWRALGIDVDLALYGRARVALCDLAHAPVILPAPADVVWSVEVAEHIPPPFVANYITTLAKNTGKFLVLTCNQRPGGLHVNCQPMAWWEERMAEVGMRVRSDILGELLQRSTMQREFLRETGRVFDHAH